MNTERLLKLADIVERAADAEGFDFDMGIWGCTNLMRPSLSCGTSACMLGTAAISGEIEGLGYLPINEAELVDGGHASIQITLDGEQKGPWLTEHAAEFFGISVTEAAYLFLANEAPANAPYHAKRVRDFVARGGIPE